MQYWARMVQAGCWVDSVFVQMTAWFLGLDILILTTSATQTIPFIQITGNVTNTLEFSSGPPLLLGNYTNLHYQSLVPLNKTFHHEYQQTRTPAEEETENTTTDDFVYVNDGQTVVFHSVDAEKLKCPACRKSFQRLISHITNKSCNIVKMIVDIN